MLAEREGVFGPASRIPNKDGPISRKRLVPIDLAFSGAFFRFRLFASVFGSCQRNITRNVTQGDGHPKLLARESASVSKDSLAERSRNRPSSKVRAAALPAREGDPDGHPLPDPDSPPAGVCGAGVEQEPVAGDDEDRG